MHDLLQKIESINKARRAGQSAPESPRIKERYHPSQKLFVYGTLGPGQPNEYLLRSIGGSWREATLQGHIRRPGPDNNLRYPLLLLDANGPTEQGHVFSSASLPGHWNRLDRFEGPAYVRLLALVQYGDGRPDVANVYAASPGAGA